MIVVDIENSPRKETTKYDYSNNGEDYFLHGHLSPPCCFGVPALAGHTSLTRGFRSIAGVAHRDLAPPVAVLMPGRRDGVVRRVHVRDFLDEGVTLGADFFFGPAVEFGPAVAVVESAITAFVFGDLNFFPGHSRPPGCHSGVPALAGMASLTRGLRFFVYLFEKSKNEPVIMNHES